MWVYFKALIDQVIYSNSVLGTIKHNFNSRDPVVILVRPILDFTSTIWNSH